MLSPRLASLLLLGVFASGHVESATLSLTATPVAVGVEATYTQEDGDATAKLYWRRRGEADWRNGVEPTYDRKRRLLWASIWPLTPGETIEVKMVVRAGKNERELTSTIATRTLELPKAMGRTFYVSPKGDDANPGEKSKPFRTLAHAAKHVRPGDSVLVRSGVYVEGNLFRGLKGTAAKPIVIQSAPGEHPILDSSHTVPKGSAWKSLGKGVFSLPLPEGVACGNYVAQDGLRMFRQATLANLRAEKRGVPRAWFYDKAEHTLYVRLAKGVPARHTFAIARHDYGFWLSGSSHLVLSGFTLRNYGAVSVRLSEGATGCVVRDCHIHNAPGGFFLKGETTRHNAIWHNRIEEPGLVDFPWGVIKTSGYARQGIFCVAGRGTSICYNRIDGWFDGVAIESWKRPEQLELNRDSDVMYNTILNTGDDAIEADGGGVNMRIHGNRMRNVHTALSLAPVERGPLYCTRNEATFKALMFKLNVNGCTSLGWAYSYHNSGYCLVQGADGGTAIRFPPSIPCSNKVFKNNVIVCNEWALAQGKKGYELDGNCYYNVPGKPARKFNWQGKSYRTLADFRRASGQESHGIYSDPKFQATPDVGRIPSATDWLSECPSDHPLAKDLSVGNLHLRAESPCIDSGVLIRGITDGHSGKGPDRGAWESE